MKKLLVAILLGAVSAGIHAAQGSTDDASFLTNHVSFQEFPGTNTIQLFNGTNLDGFTFCMKNDADPAKTWSVENGVIHCNGSATGYLRTKESFSNYALVVIWRFVKVEPKKDNSGVLIHMQLPDKVWPMCIQNQGKSSRQGDLFVMAGAECKEHLALGKDANTPVAFTIASPENPVGEWNTNVTVCGELGNPGPGHEGAYVYAAINGKLLNTITQCTVSNGFIGIQSEGADFEIRKMYLDPMPTPPAGSPESHDIPAILDPKFGPKSLPK